MEVTQADIAEDVKDATHSKTLSTAILITM